MTVLTRRTLFAAAAAATTATALTPLMGRNAFAATAPSGKQTAGWYRYKIGTFEVTVATDGVAFPGLFTTGRLAAAQSGYMNSASSCPAPTTSRILG